MKILSTFENQYQGVFLSKFISSNFYKTPPKYETELDKIQDQFQDPLFLKKFIESPESGWKKGWYANETSSFLIQKIIKESSELFDKLNEIRTNSKNGDCFNIIFDEFVELSPNERYDDPGRKKMYTYRQDSLLRLYGVRVGSNSIILTGGGIKLVKKMCESKFLVNEINKMDYLIEFLNKKNITDLT